MPMKPWNKGRKVGRKPALLPEHIRTIKNVMAENGSPLRDRALFSLAIDSSLRASDLVKLRVSDVMEYDEIKRTICVLPMKTKQTGIEVVFEPVDWTRDLLKTLVDQDGKCPSNFLFVRLRGSSSVLSPKNHLTERAYSNLVKKWVSYAGLNPTAYGTHSLRRALPAHIYANTKNIRACQVILGHASIVHTQAYLGIEYAETLEITRKYRL